MKNKGITLIEGLVVIAALAIVLVICSLALYGARKEARDVKRVSDIEVLRSSLAAVKVQFGSYLESGCEAGAVFICQNTNLALIMPTIANFKDPKGTVNCSEDCTQPCQYSFSEGMTEESFEVLFYLEKGIGRYPDSGCYKLDQTGIAKR